jgi:hypothetical protein
MNSQDAYSYRTLMVRLAHLEQQAEMLEDRVLIMEIAAQRLKETVDAYKRMYEIEATQADQYQDMFRRAIGLHVDRHADD